MRKLFILILCLYSAVLFGQTNDLQKITNFDGEEADFFGSSNSLYGDYLVVGAPYDDDNGGSSGSVYFYQRNMSGEWVFVQKIVASDGNIYEYFGYSVSLDDDQLAVGALKENENGQIVWEETGETEPIYTLVDHGTYKAALVSCKLI